MSENILLYQKSPRVKINGLTRMIDSNDKRVTPVMADGVMMVPAFLPAEAFALHYTGNAEQAEISNAVSHIKIMKNCNQCIINGSSAHLSAVPIALYGHLYVPLSDVCKVFGKHYAQDKCGIAMAGDSEESFDWNDRETFDMLNQKVRDIIYEIATPDEIILLLKEKNPNQAHPRILLTAEKAALLRERVKNTEPYKSWMQNVLKEADGYLNGADGLRYELRDGVRLLYVSREALLYIENMAFAYQMTGDKKYSKAVRDVLMKVCGEEFPDWHPYHFLDTAEMAAAVALGYDWCYDELTKAEKDVVKSALVEKALKPVMEDYHEVGGRQRTWYWSSKSASPYPQNWVSVCFGGTSMAALAIGDEDLGDFTEAGNVICEGMERVKDWQEKHMPDGVCPDGTGYWEFSMAYMALGISSMETSLGTDYSLSASPGFGLTFEWLAQLMGSDGGYNFGSNDPSYTNSPEYFWWGNKTNNAALVNYRLKQHLTAWNLSPSWKDVLWYEPIEETGDMELNTSYEARTVSMAVLRNGYDATDTWVALKGGNLFTDGITDQIDNGSFVFDMSGTRWAMDLGSEWLSYQGGVPRNQLYRFRAEEHNTVIAEPGAASDHNPFYTGKQERMDSNDVSSLAIYDFTDLLAYKGVDSWKRGIWLDKEKGSFMIQDELSAKRGVEYYWFMHTEADIKISEDGRSAVLTKDNKQISANLISDDDSLKFSVMEAAPLPTSPNPDGQEDNSKVKKLTVHSDDIENVNMAVEFAPIYGDTENAGRTELVSLDSWQLKEKSDFDQTLTLNSLSINGKPVDGFAPDVKRYSIELGLAGTDSLPEIEAKSENALISFVAPTAENYTGKIILSDADNNRYNEYYIDFYNKDFSKAAITIPKTPVYAYGDKPAGLNKLAVSSVTSSHIPQPQNPPEALIDGNFSTRHSTYGLGTTIDFDLGSTQTINYIGNATMSTERGELYVLAASDDGVNWKEVISVRTDGSGNMEVYEIPETKARYMRMYACGNTNDGSIENAWWSVTEVAFFSK